MKPMRAIGGFTVAKGMYYNPRTTVNPPMEVVLKTPFKFAYNFCDAIWASVVNDDSPGSTAHTFLSLMKNVGVIFIQDATALWILHEDRRTHPLFHLDVFQLQEWKVSLFDLLQCLACHILCFIKFFSCLKWMIQTPTYQLEKIDQDFIPVMEEALKHGNDNNPLDHNIEVLCIEKLMTAGQFHGQKRN